LNLWLELNGYCTCVFSALVFVNVIYHDRLILVLIIF